jgi:hypothetical protein
VESKVKGRCAAGWEEKQHPKIEFEETRISDHLKTVLSNAGRNAKNGTFSSFRGVGFNPKQDAKCVLHSL